MELFSCEKPPHRYLPEHAIWFQTSKRLKASVTVVSQRYRCQVFNKITGEEIHRVFRGSLRAAMKEVLRIIEYKKEEAI